MEHTMNHAKASRREDLSAKDFIYMNRIVNIQGRYAELLLLEITKIGKLVEPCGVRGLQHGIDGLHDDLVALRHVLIDSLGDALSVSVQDLAQARLHHKALYVIESLEIQLNHLGDAMFEEDQELVASNARNQYDILSRLFSILEQEYLELVVCQSLKSNGDDQACLLDFQLYIQKIRDEVLLLLNVVKSSTDPILCKKLEYLLEDVDNLNQKVENRLLISSSIDMDLFLDSKGLNIENPPDTGMKIGKSQDGAAGAPDYRSLLTWLPPHISHDYNVEDALGVGRTYFGTDHIMDITTTSEAESELALLKRQAALGAKYPLFLVLLEASRDLAVLYIEQGQHKTAKPLLQRCVQEYEYILGCIHPLNLDAMDILAMVYIQIGEYDGDLVVLLEECFEFRTCSLGSDHPDTLRSMNNLAVLYAKQGFHNLAENLYRECLSIRGSILGENHPDTIFSAKNLVSFLRSQGKLDATKELSRKYSLKQSERSSSVAQFDFFKCTDDTKLEAAVPVEEEPMPNGVIVEGCAENGSPLNDSASKHSFRNVDSDDWVEVSSLESGASLV